MTQHQPKERPITLKSHEVRAILDGTQTVLYRPMKRQPEGPGVLVNTPAGELWYVWPHEQEPGVWVDYFCAFPWGKVGARLWGRETFFVYASGEVIYRADYGPESYEGGATGWSSSAQMPHYHSRILLEVLEVRSMRVQDASLDDMRATGVRPTSEASLLWRETLAENFRDLWNTDNPRHPYAGKPWAWRIEIRRLAP